MGKLTNKAVAESLGLEYAPFGIGENTGKGDRLAM